MCILCDDGVCVSGYVDHIVLALALSGDQLEARALYDRPLDIDIAIVVISNDNCLILVLLHKVPLVFRKGMRSHSLEADAASPSVAAMYVASHYVTSELSVRL